MKKLLSVGQPRQRFTRAGVQQRLADGAVALSAVFITALSFEQSKKYCGRARARKPQCTSLHEVFR